MYNRELGEVTNIPVEDVSGRYTYWSDKVDTITSSRITRGFKVTIRDDEYLVKYDLVSQLNLSNARSGAILSMQRAMLENTDSPISASVVGVDRDGSINYDVMGDNSTVWMHDMTVYDIHGHKVHMYLSAREVLEICRVADEHVATIRKLSEDTWLIPLQACKSITEMDTLAVGLHIDREHLRVLV